MTLPPLIAAMRPRQWSKNVFVLAGIVFAGQLFDRTAQLRVLSCFALFCAASSAVYLVNDVVDRVTDRHHPLKRLRPVASGRLSPAIALAASLALAAGALAAAALLNGVTLAITAAYLASTFVYSLWIKRVFLLDVMTVAAGFVLRAVAGAACIDAEISPWLLVCSFLLALFLALGKRRSELLLLGQDATNHRAALGHYSLPLVDSWLTALAAITVHFTNIRAAIRRVEETRRAAEPSHVRALQDFAERAYRRPMSPAERDDVATFYRTLRRQAIFPIGLGWNMAVLLQCWRC